MGPAHSGHFNHGLGRWHAPYPPRPPLGPGRTLRVCDHLLSAQPWDGWCMLSVGDAYMRVDATPRSRKSGSS